MSQYLEILKQAKSYKVNRSKINDENQKMGAKIEETAFNKRNNLTRDKETQYITYLKLKLGCEDVRIHNWKLVDLSNGYKEEKRNQPLDDKIPDVIVEFSCKGYFHNKFNISYNEIKDNKDILEVMYSVYEYDQLDLNITDKKILEQQIKKTTLWIKEKKRELESKDDQELRNKLEKAKQALADAKEMVEKPNFGEDESRKDFVYARQKQLPQFEARKIEKNLREAFANLQKDPTILDQNNDIEVNVADPFDYLRWWYPIAFEKQSKQQIVQKIATNSNPPTWLSYGSKQKKTFKERIGYAFNDLLAAFREALETLNPNEPNEDPINRLFNTSNLNMNSDDFGTLINKRTMGDLFTLKYKGVFYYVMVDAEDNDNIKEIRLAKYLNEQAKEAAEMEAREEELEAGESSDADSIQSEERSDEDYKTGDDPSYDSDSDL